MKKWYQSKTIIANLIAIVAIIVAGFGVDIDTELQIEIGAAILAVVNIVLRFVTNQGIE